MNLLPGWMSGPVPGLAEKSSVSSALLVGLIIFALAYLTMLAVLGARGVFSNRVSDSDEPHAWTLRQLWFDGRSPVHVDPMVWQVAPEIVRRIAHDRGYVETAQQYSGALSFHNELPPGVTGNYRPPDGFHWLQPFDRPSTVRETSREQRLDGRLRDRQRLWVSLRDAGLSRYTVEALASRNGMAPTVSLVDETDQLILFDAQGGLAHLPASPGGTTSVRPQVLRTAVGNIVGLVLGAGVGALFVTTGKTILLWVAVFLFVAVPSTVTLSSYVLGRSHEARILESEFSSSNSTILHVTLYRISQPLSVQLGSIHGYAYGFSCYRSIKRAGIWTKFVRNRK